MTCRSLYFLYIYTHYQLIIFLYFWLIFLAKRKIIGLVDHHFTCLGRAYSQDKSWLLASSWIGYLGLGIYSGLLNYKGRPVVSSTEEKMSFFSHCHNAILLSSPCSYQCTFSGYAIIGLTKNQRTKKQLYVQYLQDDRL